MSLPTEKWLTVKELAEQLRYDERTVRDWLKKGVIKGSNLTGRKWLVRPEDLEEYRLRGIPQPGKGQATRDEVRVALGQLVDAMWLPSVAGVPVVPLTGQRAFRVTDIGGRPFYWVEQGRTEGSRTIGRRKTVFRCWFTDDQERWLLSVLQWSPAPSYRGLKERYLALQDPATEYIHRAFQYRASFVAALGWWSIEQIEDAIFSGQRLDRTNSDIEPGMWLLDNEPLVLGQLEDFKRDLLLALNTGFEGR